MMKNEFEELIGGSVTDEEYKLIEEVYMWHPALIGPKAKATTAELYKQCGLVIFYDMYSRAMKMKELQGQISNLDRVRNDLMEKMRNVKKGIPQ